MKFKNQNLIKTYVILSLCVVSESWLDNGACAGVLQPWLTQTSCCPLLSMVHSRKPFPTSWCPKALSNHFLPTAATLHLDGQLCRWKRGERKGASALMGEALGSRVGNHQDIASWLGEKWAVVVPDSNWQWHSMFGRQLGGDFLPTPDLGIQWDPMQRLQSPTSCLSCHGSGQWACGDIYFLAPDNQETTNTT